MSFCFPPSFTFLFIGTGVGPWRRVSNEAEFNLISFPAFVEEATIISQLFSVLVEISAAFCSTGVFVLDN